MEIPSWIDSDIINNPMYWLLTAGAEFALLIGFKAQGWWGSGVTMPFFSKLGILLIIPIVSYFVVMKFRS